MGAVRDARRAPICAAGGAASSCSPCSSASPVRSCSRSSPARAAPTARSRASRRTSRSADVEIDAGGATPAQLAELRRVPGVSRGAQLEQLTLVRATGPSRTSSSRVAAQIDRRFGTEVDRPRVIEGRAADLDALDELTIGESLAPQLHLGVGDRLQLRLVQPGRHRAVPDDTMRTRHGPQVTFRIVGIVRRPLDLGGRGAAGGVIVPTPAFLARYRDEIGSLLRGGAAGPHGARQRRRRTGHAGGTPDLRHVAETFGVTSLEHRGPGRAERDRRDDRAALYIAAAIAALTALVGIAIALVARGRASSTSTSSPSARSGCARARRALAAAAMALPVALVGRARRGRRRACSRRPCSRSASRAKAEPDPGLRFDAAGHRASGSRRDRWQVLVVAAIAGCAPLARRGRAPRPSPRASRRARPPSAGAPPPIAVGVRLRARPRSPAPRAPGAVVAGGRDASA